MKPIPACTLLYLALLGTLGGAQPALAQYKVVGADGSVTYTDRPPAESDARVTAIGRSGAPVAPASGGDSSLPLELRQLAQRFPVTLYTTADCAPCDNGRRLLQARGVPYGERRIASEEDALALERLVGGRTVPALMVGAQPLRGFAEGDWISYLDAAGYPRESKLPRNWQPPVATALVERAQPSTVPRAQAPAPPPAQPTVPPPAPSGIRF